MISGYRRLLSGLMALFALTLSPLIAQDTTPTTEDISPLLQILSLIPNTPEGRDGIPVVSYIDYEALDAAWPGSATYNSWQEWNAVSEGETDDLGFRLWMANRQRMMAGPSFWQYFFESEETSTLVGFDLLEIEQAATFGQPPTIGNVLLGEFDEDKIIEAFTARDYQASEFDDVSLLFRHQVDGTGISLENRNPANPFGGDLGRLEPVAVAPNTVLNSPSLKVLEDMIDVHQESESSLGEQPAYAAVAHAITEGEGSLIQAVFLDPLDVGMIPTAPIMMNPELNPTEIAAALENPPWAEGYTPLPAYALAVMADRQEEGEQVNIIALVYREEDEAAAAAAELTQRLTTFSNMIVRGTDTPIIENIEGAVVSEPRVFFDEAADRYVAIAEVRYPMPDNTLYNLLTGEPVKEGESGSPRPAGLLFRQWVNAIYQRSFTPLVIEES